MLHLSTKGYKKSYAAKAACLTAGLVAVFASSSVLADTTLPSPTSAKHIRCAYKNGDASTSLNLRKGSAPGTFMFYDGVNVVANPTELTCNTTSGDPVTLESTGSGVKILVAGVALMTVLLLNVAD